MMQTERRNEMNTEPCHILRKHAMEMKPIYIAIVDISGYTNFVQQHAGDLVHAERVVVELLESLIRSALLPLVVHEVTGDAVTFYAMNDGSREIARTILEHVESLLKTFNARRKELLECSSCGVCARVPLRPKAIVHTGEAVFSTVGRFTKIAGPDVILAHRLLKNSVVEDEYMLLTREFCNRLEHFIPAHYEWQTEQCEDFGEVSVLVCYPENSAASLPAPAKSTGSRNSCKTLTYIPGIIGRDRHEVPAYRRN